MQQAAPTAQPMPQMTPEVRSYGPMHQALSQAFSQYLGQMTQPGLLSPPSREAMGLLSPEITPAQAVSMPTRGGGTLEPNQYYRLDSDFWRNIHPVKRQSLPVFRDQASGQAAPTAPAATAVGLDPQTAAYLDMINASDYGTNTRRGFVNGGVGGVGVGTGGNGVSGIGAVGGVGVGGVGGVGGGF